MTTANLCTEYTIITMRFNYPDTWCVVQNTETEEKIDIRLTELAQNGDILKNLNEASLAALMCQLEQEQYLNAQ